MALGVPAQLREDAVTPEMILPSAEHYVRNGERYLGELRALIDAARHPVGAMATPADFPLARVDQARLDDLLSRI